MRATFCIYPPVVFENHVRGPPAQNISLPTPLHHIIFSETPLHCFEITIAVLRCEIISPPLPPELPTSPLPPPPPPMATGEADEAPTSCPSRRRPHLRRRPDPARGDAETGWAGARRGSWWRRRRPRVGVGGRRGAAADGASGSGGAEPNARRGKGGRPGAAAQPWWRRTAFFQLAMPQISCIWIIVLLL
ncbi:unnamed protein product [Urochloa humidicola]